MRKITLFLAALLISMTAFAVAIPNGTQLYLKPGSPWTKGDERFAAYFFEPSTGSVSLGTPATPATVWVDMTIMEDDATYVVTAPTGKYQKVIFCRMNGAQSANNWDNRWEQTDNLVYDGTNPCYTITSSSNGKATGSWGAYVPTPTTWTVAGSSAELFGTAWCTDCTANDLTAGTDGVWTKVYDDVTLSAGEIQYKVLKNHGWTTSFPGSNANLTIAEAGKYDVTFTFNATSKAVSAIAEKVVEKPAITASWSIAEGAEVETFSAATITFTGVDAVKAKNSYGCTWFYEKGAEGDWQLVANSCSQAGYMDAAATGTSFTLSLDPSCYSKDYVSPFSRKGEYRIVIPVGGIYFNGDNTNVNTEEYVLNFVIDNDFVELEEIDAKFTVNPENNTTVSEIREIVLTFPEYETITVAELDLVRGSNIPAFMKKDDLTGAMMPVGYIFFEAMADQANALRLYVPAEMMGMDAITMFGEYQIVIPAGVVTFGTAGTSKEIELNYTVGEVAPAGVTATWSIEEGAEVESFTSVDVTFSGVDTLGRTLGEEVKRATVLAYGESFFYSVDEEGNKTPVVTDKNEYGQPGIMSSTYNDALTQTLSLSSDDYKFYEEAFVKNGKYCIVIPAGAVKFRIDGDDETDVRNTEEFVLNFTIKNDIVMPEAVEAAFKVTPDTAATNKVESLTEVIVEFTEYDTVTIKDVADDGFSTYAECGVYEEFESFYGEIFTDWMSKAAMSWSAVEGKPNALRLYVDADYNQGDTALVMPNTYIVRIPAGVVYFTDTKFNESLELRITVDNEAIEVTKVEEMEANPYKRLLYKGLELEVKKVSPDPEDPDYTIDQVVIAGTDIPVSGLGQIVPLKLDVYGVYKTNYAEYYGVPATPTFVIEEVVAVQKFNLFSDMISYLEGATDAEKALSYEVAEEVVVSFVNPKAGAFYFQYGVMIQDGWDMVESSRGVKVRNMSDYVPAVGDKVTVKGRYQPMVAVTDDWGEVESIEATAEFVAESVTKVASKQAIPAYEVAENVIIGGDIAGTYVALADGKVVEKDGAYYYERVRTEEVLNEETWEWDVVDVIDSLALINVGNIEELVKETEEPLYAIVEFDVVAQAVQIWAIGYGDYYTPEVETAVENAEVANIYTENGMIVAEGEFAIYTITGQNVTEMNGRLAAGIYVVRTANATAKVVVK